jgi:bisphosphoglycerate-dependent phosphoglycerate mutase
MNKSKHAVPQDVLAKQQATLRTLITKLTSIADEQIDAINIEKATWADVALFAWHSELAEDVLESLMENE